MAESHNLKLVISADTSDAKKKLEDVGKTKVDPVKVDVVAEKVKVDTPTVDPIKVPVNEVRGKSAAVEHPAETVEVQEVRGRSAAVEHPAETVEVKAVVTPDPVKPRVEQPKPITIQGRFDSTVFGQITKSLHSVHELAARVMSAFGLFGFAVNGVMAIVSGIKELHDWLDRAEKKAADLNRTITMDRLESNLKLRTAALDKFNKSLAESVRLEKERSEISASRKAVSRDLEDAQTEAKKATEIAALDPNDRQYAAKKAEIERRYASQASTVAVERAREDSTGQAAELRRGAALKDREASALSGKLAGATRDEERALAARNKASAELRRDPENEEKKKNEEEAEKAWEAAYDFAKKIREQMEAAQNEAKSMRVRAGELTGNSLAAKTRDRATQTQLETDRRVERAEADKAAAESDKADRDFRKDLTRSEKDAEYDRAYAAGDDTVKKAILSAREALAEERRTTATAAYEQEMQKAPAERDESLLAELRAAISAATSASNGYRAQREGIEIEAKKRDDEKDRSFAASINRNNELGGDRLTGMGLGSGLAVPRTVDAIANDVRAAVGLLRENVAAVRAIDTQYSSSMGYTE